MRRHIEEWEIDNHRDNQADDSGDDDNRLDLDAAEFVIPAEEETSTFNDSSYGKTTPGLAWPGELDDKNGSQEMSQHDEADGKNGSQEMSQHDETMSAVNPGLAPKKKKSKKKSKSKRGLNAPTGFEEFYVDAPITPAEHEEEKGLYHESLLFSERIQTAIQRYFAKRNLNSERKDLFDKYMAFGGISAGPKMFSGGLDANTLANSNADEIRIMNATHYAPAGRGGVDDHDFVVDFEGCAKGFLSSRMPSCFDLSSQQQIKSYIAVIRNFLNYILHHDVCPEYNDQINATRRLCDQAEQELWKIAQAQGLIPGDVNRACSEIFGGFYQGLYVGDQEWAEGVESSNMSPEIARKVFRIALAAQASDTVFEQYKAQTADRSIRVTSILQLTLQVTETIPAGQEARKIYKRPEAAGLRPVGKLKTVVWPNPLEWDEDLTVEEEAEKAATAAGAASEAPAEFEFWVEDELLRHLFVGMKFETQVHRTSFGFDYFDVVTAVWCSFFTLLPNEQMIGWREPGPKLPMREKPVEDAQQVEQGEDGGEGENVVDEETVKEEEAVNEETVKEDAVKEDAVNEEVKGDAISEKNSNETPTTTTTLTKAEDPKPPTIITHNPPTITINSPDDDDEIPQNFSEDNTVPVHELQEEAKDREGKGGE